MTLATIDLGAYRSNLATLCEAVRPAEVMAVVKADAYGHGLLPVSRAAVDCGIRWLGALDVATALELRASGLGADTRVFAWHLPVDMDYRAVIDNDIDLGISTAEQLRSVETAGASRAAKLHLKIDTGLHRNGAMPAEWPSLVRKALELERAGAAQLYGAWTHIAEASYEEDSAAIQRFDDAVEVAEKLGARFSLLHLAASAAGFDRRDSRFDLVRFGAFGYGISPGGGITATELGLIPVMTLSTVTMRDADGSIVVPLGYGDGISSRAAGRVPVCVDGQLAGILRVELDRLVLGDEGLQPGAEAILFGSGKQGEWTLQQWADATDTIGEEIVTRLVRDIPRKYC